MKKKLLALAPLIIILILALGLRLPLLNGSFWLDEAAQALESARPFVQQWQIKDDFQPPFLHYLLHFALYISAQEWWLRFWGALVPGLISVAASYFLAQRTQFKHVGKKIAIVTSILIATNSFHVFLSQELRPYMWSAAWAALSLLALWEFLYQPTKKEQTVMSKKELASLSESHRPLVSKPLVAWIIFSIFGLYTSYLYPFVFFGQLVILAWKKNWRALFIGVVTTILAFLPWLKFFLQQLSVGTQLSALMPGWTQTVSFDQFKSIWLTIAKFIYGVSDLEINAFYLITGFLLALALLYIVVTIFRLRPKKEPLFFKSYNFIFLLISLVLPLLTAWLVSFFVPVIQPKRVIFLLPNLYLIIVMLAFHAYQKTYDATKKPLALLIIPLLLILNFTSLFQYYTDPQLQREDWRGLQEKIYATQIPTTTAALFSYLKPFSPWRWYEERIYFADGKVTDFSTGTYYLPENLSALKKLNSLANYETVLLFDYLRDLTDPDRQLDKFLLKLGFQETGFYDYPNLGLVRIFTQN